MALVRVEPAGFELAVEEPMTIMAAAEAAGFLWPTVCKGQGTCTTCYVRVLHEPAHLSVPTAFENEGLSRLNVINGGQYTLRLACQAQVEGDVTVFKRGVRRAQ
jgi:ferredoxin, 2Fe-2S